MRVVVPYVDLHPTTQFVLDMYKVEPEYVRLDREDEAAYSGLLKQLWAERESFIMVEQDIVPWPGALQELWDCPCDWGAYSYMMLGGYGIYHALGCTKITSTLIENTPGLWDEPERWDSCDQRLWFTARAKGMEPHPHRPHVIHLTTKHQR